MRPTSLREAAAGVLAGLLMAACTLPAAQDERAAAIAFRDRVVAVLAREFPARQFESGDDPELLQLGESQFGLQNLRAKFEAAGEPAGELDAMVKAHFESALATVDSVTVAPKTDWSSVRALVRPQLAPAEYLDRIPLVHAPFARGVVKAFVVDRPDSYQFVVAEDLGRWGITLAQLDAAAVGNLDDSSQPTAVTERGAAGDQILLVETGDGYDAAKLLVPAFRTFAAERLGSPFRAAVPSRDLLIMWSASSSPQSQSEARRLVAEAFGRQPYRMSQSVFEVTAEAVTELDR